MAVDAKNARLLCGRRSKYLVLAAWLVALAVAGPLALKLSEVQNNDQLTALSASAESTLAQHRADAAFPEPDGLVAVAVYARDGGLTAADKSKVDADRAAFAGYADGAIPPAVASDDGQAMLLTFRLAADDDVQHVKDRLHASVPGGLKVALTGSAAAKDDIFDAFAGMDGALLLATGLAVALLLILTYRSPVLWLLPLLAVGIANQLASATVYLLARYAGLTVDFQSQSILTILVFGVGVDYALLLISRYREELRAHEDRHRAMAVALRRSFPAIAASAATVSIGLLCLLAADLPSTRGLGPVGAAGVLAAFLVMTLLLPAFIVLFGRWVFWPFVPRFSASLAADETDRDTRQHRFWARIAGGVARRPRTIWIGTALVLAVLTLGIGNLTVGLPGDESFTKEVGSVTGQHLIAAHFPGGATDPADILVTAGSADRISATARAVPGVAAVQPADVSADGRWARIRAVLADPPESRAALRTVQSLRDAVHAVPGADALVAGRTAANLDNERTTDRDNRVVMPLILGAVLLILIVLLRGLVGPLLLLASVVLSYLAALGAAGLVLDAIGHPRLWSALPLQTFLFLVALGVDYTIFLMTRAREEVAQFDHPRGVLRALTVTGGVITSAGVVLAATFTALCVLPLVPSVQTAVIVAVGVLLDTVLVRSLLIPALVLHVGRRTWWPGRLSKHPSPPSAAAPSVPAISALGQAGSPY